MSKAEIEDLSDVKVMLLGIELSIVGIAVAATDISLGLAIVLFVVGVVASLRGFIAG